MASKLQVTDLLTCLVYHGQTPLNQHMWSNMYCGEASTYAYGS